MSGIKILKRLLMKEEMKKNAPFQNEGIMSISKALTTNVDSKVNRIVEGAKKQGIDFDQYNEQQVKYILELNRPKLQPRAIPADSPEGRGITKALLGRKKGKVIKTDFGKPFAQEVKERRGPVETTENMPGFGKVNVDIDYSASLNNPNYFGNAKNMYGDTARSGPEFFKQIKQFHLNQINRKKKEMVSRNHPNYKLLKKSLQDQEDSLTAAQIAEELGGNENMYDALRIKQINDPNAKPLKKSNYIKDADDPNYDAEPADFDPDADNETFAQGGRAGFRIGSIDKKRRAFLKFLGGAGAGIAALKAGALKMFGKEGAKNIPQVVTTPPIKGKPEWFDSLVNKVIAEGDDVTKKLATKERETVHTVKLTDKPKSGYASVQDDQITVYRDLDDGTVRVEYNSVDNMSEAPVNLTFKPGMADETTKGAKPADTFQADEIVPESRMDGPDDFVIEDAVDEFDNVVDLNSDVSKLKEYAGQKLTTKEIAEGINKRKRSRAITEDRGEADDFMTSRQGEYDPDPDDFASGGIARLLGE